MCVDVSVWKTEVDIRCLPQSFYRTWSAQSAPEIHLSYFPKEAFQSVFLRCFLLFFSVLQYTLGSLPTLLSSLPQILFQLIISLSKTQPKYHRTNKRTTPTPINFCKAWGHLSYQITLKQSPSIDSIALDKSESRWPGQEMYEPLAKHAEALQQLKTL